MVIARRQPMAVDLDEVLANFRIVEDLERIGDLAKNIAKRSTVVGGVQFPDEVVVSIETLANLASDQLKRGLEAYVARDGEQALAVREMDDEVDQLYVSVRESPSCGMVEEMILRDGAGV
jgi:phosphate transport system protein